MQEGDIYTTAEPTFTATFRGLQLNVSRQIILPAKQHRHSDCDKSILLMQCKGIDLPRLVSIDRTVSDTHDAAKRHTT